MDEQTCHVRELAVAVILLFGGVGGALAQERAVALGRGVDERLRCRQSLL